MISRPSLAEGNGNGQGRNADGTFASGNRYGTGNPMAKRVNRLRVAMLQAVKPDDVRQIIRVLIENGKKGDVVAAREALDRIFGKPIEIDVLERLDVLEAADGVER